MLDRKAINTGCPLNGGIRIREPIRGDFRIRPMARLYNRGGGDSAGTEKPRVAAGKANVTDEENETNSFAIEYGLTACGGEKRRGQVPFDVEKVDERSKEQRRVRFLLAGCDRWQSFFLVAPPFNATSTLCPFNGSFE